MYGVSRIRLRDSAGWAGDIVTRIEIDLDAQTITSSDGDVFSFEVDAFKKHCLMNGLDDIGLTMKKAASIDSFEASAATARPWI